MAITADALKTLDFAFRGEPFCNVGPAGIDFGTLDWAYGGEPFYAVSTASASATQSFMWVSA
jgi:hypothetical protein